MPAGCSTTALGAGLTREAPCCHTLLAPVAALEMMMLSFDMVSVLSTAVSNDTVK